MKTVGLLILVLLLAACAQGGSDPNATQIPATGAGLEQTRWELENFGAPGAGDPPVGDTPLTLEFGDGNVVSGSAGCNSFSGGYTIDDVGITFHEVASTLMACADQAVTEQETQFLQLLQNARNYTIEQDRLILADEAGTPLLTFTRAGS